MGGEAAAGGDRLISRRWWRTSCRQARRWTLRLQSREAAAGQRQPGAGATARSRGLRLGRGAAIPLALLAQPTGTATADAGSIDHTQASVSFSAPLVREQLLVGGATQRAIGLEREVPPREAANFEGDGNRGLPIACDWGLLLFGLGQGRSKFGGAHGSRL